MKKILHLTHGIFQYNGVETFLFNLIDRLNNFEHYIATPKNCYFDLFQSIKGYLEFNKIDELKDFVISNSIDIVLIHWTGLELLNNTNELDILNLDNKISLLMNEVKELEIKRELDPFALVNCYQLFNRFTKEDYQETQKFLKISINNDIINNHIKTLKLDEPSPIFVIIAHSESKLPNNLDYPNVDAIINVNDKVYEINKNIETYQDVYHNAIDTDIFRKYDNFGYNAELNFLATKKAKYKAVVGFTGRFNKFNQDVYNAIQIDKFKDVLFVFIGSTPQHIIDIAPKNFHFIKPISGIEYFLNLFDVFLYPTILDSFGLSLVEAMACELPCVVSPIVADITGIDSNFGYVCYKVEDYINDLDFLCNNSDVRARIGKNARKRVLEKYCLNTMIEKYNLLFLSLLKEREEWQ